MNFDNITDEKLDQLEAMIERGEIDMEGVLKEVGMEGWTPFQFQPMAVEEFTVFADILGKNNFMVLSLDILPDGRGTGVLLVSPQAMTNAREALASGF